MGLDTGVPSLRFRRNRDLIFLVAGGVAVGVRRQLPAPGWRVTGPVRAVGGAAAGLGEPGAFSVLISFFLSG